MADIGITGKALTMDLFQARAMTTACAVLATLAGSGVLAQSTDAARYVNRQGIEIIQSRGNAPSIGGGRARDTESSKPAIAKRVAKFTATPAVSGGKLFISTKQQAARDQDRLAILQEELKAERTAFESIRRGLQASAADATVGPEQRRNMEEWMVRHQRNIRALNTEIGRVRL